jgi:uncharacterized spore protein YtfJ
MAVEDIIQKITDKLSDSATVKKVYGDPIAAEGRTIIPVARVKYGFGAGSGKRGRKHDGQDNGNEGGGGGGGITAVPAGVVEVAEGETRYIPIDDTLKITAVAAAGAAMGFLLAWLIMKRK